MIRRAGSRCTCPTTWSCGCSSSAGTTWRRSPGPRRAATPPWGIEGELLLALDGKLKGKSTRLIAIDFYGKERIESVWHDGAAERGVVRRRVRDSLRLMNGGYRDLVKGNAPSGRQARVFRGKARGDISGRGFSSLPVRHGSWFSDAGTDTGRGTMSGNRRYLDTKEAATYLGLSPSTLNRMRVTGDGPRYSKVGRRVIYDIADLDEWVEKRKRRFTGEAAPA